jgi:ankyrin repeat protein
MESFGPTEQTPSFVEKLAESPNSSSENTSTFALPPHHIPSRLDDIFEEVETKSEQGSSCNLQHISAHTVREQREEAIDESTEKIPCDSEVDYSRFYKAIVRGDLGFVKNQLELGVDVEKKTYDDFSPLVIAILEGRIEIAKLLLENGASVHSRSKKLPVLIHAVKKSNQGLQAMHLVLDHGALLNTVSSVDQKNALHWAATEGMADAVDYLLSRGMDKNAKCSRGQTPLVLAAERGHVDVAKILWAQGANIEALSNNGGTPLTWAACKNNVEMVKFLLSKGANIDHNDDLGHGES